MCPCPSPQGGQSAGSDNEPCRRNWGGILSCSRHLSRTGYRSDYRTAPHHYGTLLTAKLTMTFWNVISQTSLHWDNGLHCHKSLEEENMTKKKKKVQ